ncbi:MAG: CRISPR-associated ring nuclease Crn3/Csx3 [Candidatus Jettenia sp. CY-1]|nr:MAG: CRISPR-associated ring nuclease Crn3/Csx3 [Candidatus Jettenia sp. CY-1]
MTNDVILFKKIEKDTYTLIEFQIKGDICTPNILTTLEPPEVDATRGVILSGREPVWFLGRLIHHYHLTIWIATFDPRLGGGVVASHAKGVKVGDVKLTD